MFMPPVQLGTATQELDSRTQHDFKRALRRGWLRRLFQQVLRRDSTLLPFHLIEKCVQSTGRRDLGIRIIEINRIIGSLGRFDEFDRGFMPRHEHTLRRWMSIDRAIYQGIPLPPIEVYLVGDAYFVVDGNHRISVARMLGQDFIEAHVIEIDATEAITPQTTRQDLCHCS